MSVVDFVASHPSLFIGASTLISTLSLAYMKKYGDFKQTQEARKWEHKIKMDVDSQVVSQLTEILNAEKTSREIAEKKASAEEKKRREAEDNHFKERTGLQNDILELRHSIKSLELSFKALESRFQELDTDHKALKISHEDLDRQNKKLHVIIAEKDAIIKDRDSTIEQLEEDWGATKVQLVALETSYKKLRGID